MNNKNFTIYRASAGSGKTHTIVQKVIAELLKNPQFSYRQILAVTFTIAAAGEMKERILNELRALAENAPSPEIQKNAKIAFRAILHDYGNFNITTIDSFFQKILRNLTKELGINSQFDIETDTNIIIKEAVEKVIENSAKDEKLLEKIVSFLEHKLENEKWNIRRDLENFAGNIFKEAFQKREKKLQEQIKNEPQKIADLIKKCKIIQNEFETKMSAVEPIIFDKSDFHYGDKGIISYFKKIKNGDYSEPNTYVKQVLSGEKGKIGDSQNLEILKDCENFRSQNIVKYNSACLFLKHIYPLQLLESIGMQIDLQNKEQNRFMLAKTNQFLSEIIGDSDVSFIYEKIGAKVNSAVIDEFQDTSLLQWENFKPIIKNVLAENNFGMLVGDVKQSIYRWRNGDWKILNDIENEFGESVNYKELDKNWRSAKNIVEFNNNLFKKISQNFGVDIQKAYKDVEQIPEKNEDGFVSVDFVEAEKNGREIIRKYDEIMIEKISEKINFLLESGVSQSDICILCRKGGQIRLIAEKLPKLLLEVKIISEEAYLFVNSKELRMIISALRIVENPQNLVSAAALLKLQNEKISEITKEKCEEKVKEIRAFSKFPLNEIIDKLCKKFGFYEPEISPFLSAFMDKLLAKNHDISAFLEYWDEKLKDETLPLPTHKNDKRDGILAMTIHKSKGLQFNSVIVPFVDWAMSEHSTPFKQNLIWADSADLALIPLEYSQKMSESEFAEEYISETEAQNMDNLNILYVALTRAEKNLFVLAKNQKNSVGGLIFDNYK
jgi:ATP-dependent exoDNAse (exonuclease V) beta subunit